MQESSIQPSTIRHSLDSALSAGLTLREASATLRNDESDLLQSLQRLRQTAINTLEAVHFDCDSAVSSLRTQLRKEISYSRAELAECAQSARRLGSLEKEREVVDWAERFVVQTERYCLKEDISTSKPSLYLRFCLVDCIESSVFSDK